MIWQLQEDGNSMRFLIHDCDTKFTVALRTVFATEGIETGLMPFHAPNANAVTMVGSQKTNSVSAAGLSYQKVL
jgi:hypothetical protein